MDTGAIGYVKKKDRKSNETELYIPDVKLSSKNSQPVSKTVKLEDIELDEELEHFSKQY